MTSTLITTDEGDRRKVAAHAILEAHRDIIVNRCRRALLDRLLTDGIGQATADDIRAVVFIPDGIKPVCVGSAPGELVRAGIIRRIGFTETTRAEAHARPVSVWSLLNRTGAIAWLAAHPDRPDPDKSGTGGPKQSLFD